MLLVPGSSRYSSLNTSMRRIMMRRAKGSDRDREGHSEGWRDAPTCLDPDLVPKAASARAPEPEPEPESASE